MSERKRSIDLDSFIPEPLTLIVNNETYPVEEVSVATYMRILKLSTNLEYEEARENFFSIFKESVPSLPDELIEGLNGKQVEEFLAFLITSFIEGQLDPNLQKPMSKA